MKNIETFESFINEEFGNEVSEKMNAGFKAYLDKQKAKREAKSGDKSKSKAKPDFLDLDKDGDKEETMKKAAADKKEKDGDAGHKRQRMKPKTISNNLFFLLKHFLYKTHQPN